MAVRTVFLQFTSNAGTISGQLGALTASVRSLTVAQREAELASGKQSQAFQKEQAAKESVRAANQRLQTAEQELLTARKLAVEVAQAGVQKSADEVAAHKLLQGALKDTATAQKGVDQSTQRLTTAVTQHETAARNAESAASKYGAAIEQNNQVHNRAVGSIGKVTALIGVGMVAGFAEATKAAVQWQQQMARVEATTGVSGTQLQQLSQTFLNLSGQIPKTATEIAESYIKISQEGFRGAQALQILNESSRLAVATNSDLASAASSVATVMNAWQLNLGQASNAVNIFSVAAQMANQPFDQFLQSMVTASPIAQKAGVSINEIAAATVALSQAGVTGNMAAQGLQRFLLQIGKTGTDVSDALIQVAHNAGFMNVETGGAALGAVGLTGALNGLLNITHGNMTALEQLYPSIRAARPLFALSEDGAANYQRALANLNNTTYVAIQAEAQFDAQRHTTAAQLTEFHNQWHALSIEVGQTFLPALGHVISGLETFGQTIGAVISDLEAWGVPAKDILIWSGAAVAGFLALGGAVVATLAPLKSLLETWALLKAAQEAKTAGTVADTVATEAQTGADTQEALAATAKAAADRVAGAAGLTAGAETDAGTTLSKAGAGGGILGKLGGLLGLGGGAAAAEGALAPEEGLAAAGGIGALGIGAIAAAPLAILGGAFAYRMVQNARKSAQNRSAIGRYSQSAQAELQGPLGAGATMAQAQHEFGGKGLRLEESGLGGSSQFQQAANQFVFQGSQPAGQTGWTSIVDSAVAAAGRPYSVSGGQGLASQGMLYKQFTDQIGLTDTKLKELGYSQAQVARIHDDTDLAVQGNTKSYKDLNNIIQGSLGPRSLLSNSQQTSLDALKTESTQASRSKQGWDDANKSVLKAADAREQLYQRMASGQGITQKELDQNLNLKNEISDLGKQMDALVGPTAVYKDALDATKSTFSSIKDQSAVFSDALSETTKAASKSAQDQADAYNNNLGATVKAAQLHVKHLQDQRSALAAETKALGPGATNDGSTALSTQIQAAQSQVTQLQDAQKANHKTAADFATDTTNIQVSYSTYVAKLKDASRAEQTRDADLQKIRSKALALSTPDKNGNALLPMSSQEITDWISSIQKLGPQADSVIKGLANTTQQDFIQVANASKTLQPPTQGNLDNWLHSIADSATNAGRYKQDLSKVVGDGLVGKPLLDQITKMAPDAAEHLIQQILWFTSNPSTAAAARQQLNTANAQALLSATIGDPTALAGLVHQNLLDAANNPTNAKGMGDAINKMVQQGIVDQQTADKMVATLNGQLGDLGATITLNAVVKYINGKAIVGGFQPIDLTTLSTGTGDNNGKGALDPSGNFASHNAAVAGTIGGAGGPPTPPPNVVVPTTLSGIADAGGSMPMHYKLPNGDAFPINLDRNVTRQSDGTYVADLGHGTMIGSSFLSGKLKVIPASDGLMLERHNAQIASGATMRVWAEPETGGEAYIPLSPSKRHRSTNILHEVADDFGYHLTPHARGSVDVNPFASMFKPTHIRSIAAPEVRFADGGTSNTLSATAAAGAAAVTAPNITAIITQVAKALGVDPSLALAIAQDESGLNPTAQGDYRNGQPTSFGLYQLHRGGELGNLTPQQAFDPTTNARVALAQVAAVARAHRGMDPGEIAAIAQAPADPAGYAQTIDAILGKKFHQIAFNTPSHAVFNVPKAGASSKDTQKSTATTLAAPFANWAPAIQGRSVGRGWTLQAVPGTPVLAATDGKVRFGHDPKGLGDPYPILLMSHGYQGHAGVYYGNLVPGVKDQTSVQARQPIGRTAGSLEMGFWDRTPVYSGMSIKGALAPSLVAGAGTTNLSVQSQSLFSGKNAPSPKGTGREMAGLARAISELGRPYQWGAAGPNSFDCSGLVDYAFGLSGRPNTYSLVGMGSGVKVGQQQPGDLVFFNEGSGHPPEHVGIVVNGDTMVDAPHTGATVEYDSIVGWGSPVHAIRRLAAGGILRPFGGHMVPSAPAQSYMFKGNGPLSTDQARHVGGPDAGGRFWLSAGGDSVVEVAPRGRMRSHAEGHIGQIAGAGEMRLWAEPETGGEAYIPLAPNKRGRSTDILHQVAQDFGYGLHANASGGFYPPGPSMTGGRIASSQPIINHVYNQQRVSNATNYQFNGPIEGYSLEQVTKDAERKQRYAALMGSM